MEIIIRDDRFVIERAEEFAEFCREAFREHLENNVRMGPCFMTAEKMREWARGRVVFCAYDGDKLLGFSLLEINENANPKSAYVKLTVISSEMQGKGIGSELNSSMEKYCTRGGGGHVFLPRIQVQNSREIFIG